MLGMFLFFQKMIQLFDVVGHRNSCNFDPWNVVLKKRPDFFLGRRLGEVGDLDAEVCSGVSLDIDHLVLVAEFALEDRQQEVDQADEDHHGPLGQTALPCSARRTAGRSWRATASGSSLPDRGAGARSACRRRRRSCP